MMKYNVGLINVIVAKHISSKQMKNFEGSPEVGIKLRQFDPILMIAENPSFETKDEEDGDEEIQFIMKAEHL